MKNIKIMIINPNSDLKMTESIKKTAEKFAGDEFEVICKPTQEGPKFIATYENHIQSGLGMMKTIREYESEFDAFIIACHGDPSLDAMKEITTKPVVGIGEASMKIATMLGHKFSVISPVKHAIPNKEAMITKYGLNNSLASIRAPQQNNLKNNEEELILNEAKLAVELDNAEVIVLGCAGMTGLDKVIEKKLNVPVLDGVICGLIIASGLVKYGVSISKACRYNPNY